MTPTVRQFLCAVLALTAGCDVASESPGTPAANNTPDASRTPSDTGAAGAASLPDRPHPPDSSSEDHADPYVAGAACATRADCPYGECARGVAQAPAEPGYCTAVCQKQSDCSGGATCAFTGAASRGTCLATCTDQSECRNGFRCVGAGQVSRLTVPGACRPLAMTDRLESGVAGRSCAGDLDCEGGHCAERSPVGASYPGGYCSGRCYEDSACGEGGVCLLLGTSADAGHCLRSCEIDADCGREDYRCVTFGDGQRLLRACFPGIQPLSDGAVGSACSTQADCGMATCADTLSLEAFGNPAQFAAPDGYCTHPCLLDSDCGADAQCITTGSQGGLCLAGCGTPRPCRDGYRCIAHLRDGDPGAQVCVPAQFGLASAEP